MDWMRELSSHYQQMRRQYPYEKLLLLFDIDGTILDMRYMIRDVLQSFDQVHGTAYFEALELDQIQVNERDIEPLIHHYCPPESQAVVLAWYQQHAWDSLIMHDSHRPYPGVLEVIRWFQMQDNTFVGLNSARPEALRLDTLHSLNRLGREFRVRFDSSLLFMNTAHDGMDIEAGKLEGIEFFRQKGYRVISMIDNQLANLHAMASGPGMAELLLLHTHKLFESRRGKGGDYQANLPHYEPAQLICREQMPRHVQMVWDDLNSEENVQQFLASGVHWGAMTVDSASLQATGRDQSHGSPLAESLARFRLSGRGARLSLNGDERLVHDLLPIIEAQEYLATDLWFEGRLEVLGQQGFKAIAARFPGAILQCPVDFLAPLMATSPAKAEDVLDMMSAWGINRWSISWQTRGVRQLLDQMDTWGFDTNITATPDMAAFLHAVLLLPRSITTDFSFPDCRPEARQHDMQRLLTSLRVALPSERDFL